METLIPLLSITYEGNAQAAVDRATEMIRDAVARFDHAANALLEEYADDKIVKADIVKFVDSCRYACTANLNWR